MLFDLHFVIPLSLLASVLAVPYGSPIKVDVRTSDARIAQAQDGSLKSSVLTETSTSKRLRTILPIVTEFDWRGSRRDGKKGGRRRRKRGRSDAQGWDIVYATSPHDVSLHGEHSERDSEGRKVWKKKRGESVGVEMEAGTGDDLVGADVDEDVEEEGKHLEWKRGGRRHWLGKTWKKKKGWKKGSRKSKGEKKRSKKKGGKKAWHRKHWTKWEEGGLEERLKGGKHSG